MITTKELKRLLAEHSRLTGECARHEQMAESLQAEEAKLMDTVNLENKAEFEKVSQLRLRREIVPRKIKNFEEAAERTKVKLAEEFSNLTAALLDIIRTKTEALTAKIAKALEPFFPSKRDDLDVTKFDTTAAVEKIIFDSTAGAQLIESKNRLISQNFKDLEPLRRAGEFLKLAAIVEGVEI